MNAYLEIMRPSVCLMSLLGIVIGSIVAGVFSPILVIYAIIAAVTITGGGNVINDYFDIETDKINSPHRVLPKGRLSLRKALYWFVILNIIGIGFSFLISIPFLEIAVFNFIISTVYAWKLKKTPFIGNVAVSYLGASPFLASGLILGSFTTLSYPIILLSLIAFFGTLAREILKDVRDVKGDKKIKAHTLPIVWGEKASRALASLFLLLGCALLIIPFWYDIFSFPYLIGAGPAIIACVYAITQSPPRGEKTVKIAIFLVFLGFILGSVF
jgi:geranylgeranylglycerol-phosphate geranylgeranyltransferase